MAPHTVSDYITRSTWPPRVLLRTCMLENLGTRLAKNWAHFDYVMLLHRGGYIDAIRRLHAYIHNVVL